MRKTLLLVYFICSSFMVFGQSVRLEFKAGVSLSNQSVKTLGMAVKSVNLIGFHAGGLFNIDVTDELSIQPGLFYSNKGYQYNQALSNGIQTVQKPIMGKIQLNYLEAPINVIYKFEATRKIDAYLGGGGYLGYGLSGTYAVQNQRSDIAFTKSVEGYQYKNPDYGVNAVIGSEISKHVVLEANYSLGLNNLSYYQSSIIHNRSMGLSVGYLF